MPEDMDTISLVINGVKVEAEKGATVFEAANAALDPQAKTPEYKACAIRIEKVDCLVESNT